MYIKGFLHMYFMRLWFGVENLLNLITFGIEVIQLVHVFVRKWK